MAWHLGLSFNMTLWGQPLVLICRFSIDLIEFKKDLFDTEIPWNPNSNGQVWSLILLWLTYNGLFWREKACILKSQNIFSTILDWGCFWALTISYIKPMSTQVQHLTSLCDIKPTTTKNTKWFPLWRWTEISRVFKNQFLESA